MTRRKSVQELVKPLRKLHMLNGQSSKSELSLVPEKRAEDHPQHDILSRLPRELALYIFQQLCFDDLVTSQLVCRLWCRIAQDTSIWRARCIEMWRRFPDIYYMFTGSGSLTMPWQSRYCQSMMRLNWRMGFVQRSQMISNEGGRLLSVKLKDHLLVTLTEDNIVRLYQYNEPHGFRLRSKWSFGDATQRANIVECIDILPEINTLVVAFRGSKCIFYDINRKHNTDPIQVLKTGGHPWFVPDFITLNHDYFALSGRKPSAVFVWNWRKGVRLCSRVFDNQPHSVYLSNHNLITISVDGIVNVLDIFDPGKEAVACRLPPCSMPCLTYDGGVNIVMAPFASRRIHHFQWDALPVPMYDNYASTSNSTPNETSASTTAAAPNSVTPCQSTSTPHPSETNVPTSISTSSSSSLLSSRRLSSTLTTLLGRHSKKTKSTDLSDHAPCASTEKKSAVRLRRHSSYNDYGYACQMRTAEYIRQYRSNKLIKPVHPDFSARLKLINSIRTTPLGRPALETVNIAMYHDHVATVNRYGDIALYALNGTTAARVSTHDGQCEWIENKADLRDDDDLSDGYNFVRSRLAIGSLGIVYGGRNGQLWWLDFGCKPKSI